jgi:hypothetical protein
MTEEYDLVGGFFYRTLHPCSSSSYFTSLLSWIHHGYNDSTILYGSGGARLDWAAFGYVCIRAVESQKCVALLLPRPAWMGAKDGLFSLTLSLTHTHALFHNSL